MKTKEVVNYVVAWLKNYAEQSGQDGFVVGISGGIDSAVTSALVARTGMKILCVEMPIHQNKSQANRGEKHIDALKNRFDTVSSTSIDLSSTYDGFLSQLPVSDSDYLNELALINSQARLRMTTLYYMAALNRSLVAGTGNKVEDFGIGFYTKYGDGGVDISPIADLTKTEVYKLGAELDIIDEIMEAAPTDGLWGDDRTDEDQIGASYPELEWAMSELDKGKKKEDFEGREQVVFEIFEKLNKINQHKMLPIPVCEIPYKLKY